jgi:hypothetical protein
MTLTRRTLLGSLFCAAAAPAIVRISSLMPVRALEALPAPVVGDIWLGMSQNFVWIDELVPVDMHGNWMYLGAELWTPGI